MHMYMYTVVLLALNCMLFINSYKLHISAIIKFSATCCLGAYFSFFLRTIRQWNKLPAEIAKSNSMVVFNSKLLPYLVNNLFNYIYFHGSRLTVAN